MDTLGKIIAKETELQLLYDRMDNTRDRVYNVAYELTGVDGKAMKNVISVAMPYAAIFVNSVVNDMLEVITTRVVSGDISKRQSSVIEDFVQTLADWDDERLLKGSFHCSLYEWLCSHVAVRSYIGVQYISRLVNGQFVSRLLPVDMRWTPFEYATDGEGYEWVSPTFFRGAMQVNAEYGSKSPNAKYGKLKDDFPESETNIKVRDYWGREINEVWVNEQKVREQPNPFGKPPFVIGAPPTGFMLRDEDYIEHESEDLLYLLRDMYDEMNRSFSIEQTKAMETIRPGYVHRVQMKTPLPDTPPLLGEVDQDVIPNEWQITPTPDLNQAFLTARADLMKVLSDGSYNQIDLGNVTQTVSAVWITVQSGIRKKFSSPRLKTVGNFLAQLDRMRIEQYKLILEQAEGDIIIGGTGKKRRFNPAVLGNPDDYTIEYQIRSRDPMLEIANLAQFNASAELPMSYRLENILKVSDVSGLLIEIESEKAKAADPAIGMLEMGLRLIDEAEGEPDDDEANAKLLESKMIYERLITLLKSRQQPQLPEEQNIEGEAIRKVEQPKNNPQALVSLPKLMTRGGING